MDSKKLLYIGAGLHIDPLFHFPETKEFIFVDTLPRSEFDKNRFDPIYYRTKFTTELIKNCKRKDFFLVGEPKILNKQYTSNILTFSQKIYYWFTNLEKEYPFICPTLLTFYNYNTKQTLKYYISTNLRYNMPNEQLIDDLKSCDGLIVSGHAPDEVLKNYITFPLNFIGYSDTVYIYENKYEYTFLNYIQDEKIIFKSYCVCDKKTGEIYSCENYKELHEKSIEIRKKRILEED